MEGKTNLPLLFCMNTMQTAVVMYLLCHREQLYKVCAAPVFWAKVIPLLSTFLMSTIRRVAGAIINVFGMTKFSAY